MKTVYRIMRICDGAFSTGGGHPFFKKTGKTWSTRSALSNHLACVRDYNRTRGLAVYDGCVIQEITITEDHTKRYPVSSWTTQLEARRREREQAEAAALAARERDERYKKFLELKKEFDPDSIPGVVPAPVFPTKLPENDLELIKDFLKRNLKVTAIKHYRSVMGTDLMDSKNAVEALADHMEKVDEMYRRSGTGPYAT